MTGTLANLATEETETYGLDPGPHLEVEPESAPILAACEIEAERTTRMAARFSAVPREPASSLAGYTMATLCRMHLQRQALATRAAILTTMGISTKVDAIAAVDLVAKLDGDGELVDHLLDSLRAFLTVD
jgi:hypothetical protein